MATVKQALPDSLPGKRERTRLALVEAAIAILAERDLEGTSIDDVARMAGMARGTFYNHFESREALACAASQLIRERLHSSVVDHIPVTFDAAETFTCVTYGFIHHCLQQPQTGWALVRIGGSAHWVTAEQFTRAHTALAALLPADAPLMLGLVYIEGVALMVVRRLLENVITFTEAETVIALAMQGIGVPAQRIPALQETARRFVSALSQH